MAERRLLRKVQTEMELRVIYPGEPGALAEILKVLRQSGGEMRAHLVYELGDQFVGLFVCEKPTEAAEALHKEGVAVETETVVVAQTENRWGALSHLIRSLEAEGIRVGYTYATALSPELYVVFRTDDNPKAEDILRNYLILPDEEAGDGIE